MIPNSVFKKRVPHCGTLLYLFMLRPFVLHLFVLRLFVLRLFLLPLFFRLFPIHLYSPYPEKICAMGESADRITVLSPPDMDSRRASRLRTKE